MAPATVRGGQILGEQGFGSTWRLLPAMLDLSSGQARARVRDAEQLATRRTLTGEVLPAHLPATAAALASGAIGTGQLKVITQTMAALPSTVSQDERDWAEATLAEHAPNFARRPTRHRVSHLDQALRHAPPAGRGHTRPAHPSPTPRAPAPPLHEDLAEADAAIARGDTISIEEIKAELYRP